MSLESDSQFLLQGQETHKVIADYVERNQSRLRSLLKDMSQRKLGKSENRGSKKSDVCSSYLKNYGIRSTSQFGNVTDLPSRMNLNENSPKKAPFLPAFGNGEQQISPVYQQIQIINQNDHVNQTQVVSPHTHRNINESSAIDLGVKQNMKSISPVRNNDNQQMTADQVYGTSNIQMQDFGNTSAHNTTQDQRGAFDGIIDPRYAMISDAGTFNGTQEEEEDDTSHHIIFKDAGDSFTIDKPTPSQKGQRRQQQQQQADLVSNLQSGSCNLSKKYSSRMISMYQQQPQLFKQRAHHAVPIATKALRDDLRQVKAQHMEHNLKKILSVQKKNQQNHQVLSSLDKYETNLYDLAQKDVLKGKFKTNSKESYKGTKDYKAMMSEHELKRKGQNAKHMNDIEAIDNEVTGIENETANESAYGAGQLMRADEKNIKAQQFNLKDVSHQLIRNRREVSKKFLLSGNQEAFRRVPMPNLKRQLNSRSPSPSDVNTVYNDANKLPNIDISDNSRRHSITTKVPNTTAGISMGGMDDIVSNMSSVKMATPQTNMNSSQFRPKHQPLNPSTAMSYKSMVGFGGNRDVGSVANSIAETAQLSKSLRYQPDHFNKFRRASKQVQQTQPSIEVGGASLVSKYDRNGVRQSTVTTTLNIRDDPAGAAYAKHLKKLTNHYRKGVLQMSGTMGISVPMAMNAQHTRDTKQAEIKRNILMRSEPVRHQSQGPAASHNRTVTSSNAYASGTSTPAPGTRFNSNQNSSVGVSGKLSSKMRGPGDMRLLNDISTLSGKVGNGDGANSTTRTAAFANTIL